MRLTVAEGGLLVDSDGQVHGQILSLEVEGLAYARGGERVFGLTVTSTATSTAKDGTAVRDEVKVKGSVENAAKKPTVAKLEAEAIARVWTYWKETSGKNQKLDAKRERFIRNSIRLVGEDATKLALLGLTRSPHHRGENEQRRPYMEVRYALKGLGNESDDERIEKAILWAAVNAPDRVEVDPAKVQRRLDELRYTLSRPHRPERERGEEAYRWLKAHGFKIVQLDRAPFARLER
jgi:hypothetical protein